MDKYLSGFLAGPKKHESLSLNVPVEHIKDYYQEVSWSFGALHQVAYKSDPQAMNQINELVGRQLAAQAAQEAGRLAASEQTTSSAEQPEPENIGSPDGLDAEEIRRRIASMEEQQHEIDA